MFRSCPALPFVLLCAVNLSPFAVAFQSSSDVAASAKNTNIVLQVDRQTKTRVLATFDRKQVPLGPFVLSETVTVNGKAITDFKLTGQQSKAITDARGGGQRLTLTAVAGDVEKVETVDSFSRFPTMLFLNVHYTNKGKTDLQVSSVTSDAHTLDVLAKQEGTVPFWSLQSGSYERRPDWAVPLKAGFHQDNYLGMNADDYGGGTPVIDVWRSDVGLAVGHDDLKPQLLSEPITMPDASHATVAIEDRRPHTLKAGQSLATVETFLAVHQGDYFRPLREYQRVMIAKGVHLQAAAPGSFDPIWCAWGFGRNFQPQQIEAALPEATKLQFGWVTMDDGWQNNVGDWELNRQKFPRGDADVRALVDKIHARGMKAQLWWAPLAAIPASAVYRDHPDWLLLDENHAKRKISWWNAYYLCPADPAVVRFHQKIAERIFKVWGFDGLKLDGQFFNAVPPCTNPAHHHQSSLDSVQQLPYFFKGISDAAHAVKKDALIELCPCGTSYSFFTMPYYNMTVASDPESSWQVRSKGKALKALMGDDLPFFGDHVELSDNHDDFASTVGIGGVVGTEYRWPPDDKKAAPGEGPTARLLLTPAKEQIWAKWVQIYREKMLSRGQYLGGLYDIGFDKPETHAIRKGAGLYYAFFAPQFEGTVRLRGLQGQTYKIVDYVNNASLGTVTGPVGSLKISFKRSLLISALPVNR